MVDGDDSVPQFAQAGCNRRSLDGCDRNPAGCVTAADKGARKLLVGKINRFAKETLRRRGVDRHFHHNANERFLVKKPAILAGIDIAQQGPRKRIGQSLRSGVRSISVKRR